jgi:hypothetical protein
MRRNAASLLLVLALAFATDRLFAQEPYFITYSHQMEEPGNLEIALKSVAGSPTEGNAFWGNALERSSE